ncbi:MAG: ABC transporter ATP-binding protein/permease [Oscillospiraceae bacterium]|nr:ABC transporter ATP-binding protein/permease [Oscillospiraceae bacterium]
MEQYDVTAPQTFSIATWKKLWPFLLPVRRRFLLAMLLIFLAAAVDVILPLFTKFAVDWFVVPQTTDGLGLFALAYFATLTVQGTLTIFFFRHCMVVEMEMGRQMKIACFVHLQKLSLSFFNKTPVGYILARVMSDTDRISGIVAWSIVSFFWDFLFMIGIILSMMILNWRLALVVLLVVPILAAISFLFKNKLLQVNREIRSTNAKIVGMYNEGITGAKTTKTLVIEDQITDEFKGVTRTFYAANMRSTRLMAIFGPMMVLIGSLSTALVLYYGGFLVLENLIPLGTLSVFLSYTLVILEPVQQMARRFSDFIAAQVNIERVTALLAEEITIQDTPEVEAQYGTIFTPKRTNWEPIRGDITFQNIWFRYPDGDEYVLEDFNLDIKAGTKVAIVGRTGAGKSTLVNLACRFLEPTRGKVLIDGKDYKERSLLWLQSRLGYVLQNPHLFSGTVMENIRYGKLDATDEEVIAAAKLVSADRVVEKLENGYETEVGEGGDRLSTGEKQLISFARAVLANPPIFVLDEATSSIDTETEGLIQEAISHILTGRTSFIIAHRLSTIRHAGLILVVDKGRIVEQGTHEELMAGRGKYHKLYTTMMLREETNLGAFLPEEEE